MTPFITRSLTAAVYVAVFISSIVAGHFVFFLLILILNLLAQNEFFSLFKKKILSPQPFVALITGGYVIVASYLYLTGFTGNAIFAPFPLLFFTLFLLELYSKNQTPFQNLGIVFLSIIYISFPLASFIYIAFQTGEYYSFLLIGILLLVWSNDTFAYLTGSKFGKTPLHPRISPKKTVEGTVGGAICTVIVAGIIGFYLTEDHPLIWMGLAVMAVVGSTYGDLVESMLKRSMNIKDSGKILPGHGGILDRIDALLLALPLVWAFLFLVW
jgi:phosphatidate cytidylyltransferase